MSISHGDCRVRQRAVTRLAGPRIAPLAALCLCLVPVLAGAETKAVQGGLTAAQIVDRHVAARGGLAAWHAVQTLTVSGKLEAGSGDSAARSAKVAREGLGASAKHRPAESTASGDAAPAQQQVLLPFALEMKRPHKSRMEIQFAGQTAVQVYDGTTGWKLRPFLNRNDVEPFTAEEAKAQVGTGDMDGPLIDYAAKGTKVELAGMEPVDGHDAYQLKLTTKSGVVQQIWIDAKSFLDVKVEGMPRRFDGRMRSVWVLQRDFRPVQGIVVPFEYETRVDGALQSHKMIFETAAVNRKLDDSRFAKPQPLVAGVRPSAPPTAQN